SMLFGVGFLIAVSRFEIPFMAIAIGFFVAYPGIAVGRMLVGLHGAPPRCAGFHLTQSGDFCQCWQWNKARIIEPYRLRSKHAGKTLRFHSLKII
ncbi:hypothetical protein, partial [Pseudomonas aeruginosa]|uniref:hypothetical protein n=1 Tax=Pseudomonas aeruginosa TaxID=287 RepID=UPI0035570772